MKTVEVKKRLQKAFSLAKATRHAFLAIATDKEQPSLRIYDPRLQKAFDQAKAARRALLKGGMPEGCACQLCTASRLLLSAFGTLGEIEAELAEEKHKTKKAK